VAIGVSELLKSGEARPSLGAVLQHIGSHDIMSAQATKLSPRVRRFQPPPYTPSGMLPDQRDFGIGNRVDVEA
jgi:hypothetical protein